MVNLSACMSETSLKHFGFFSCVYTGHFLYRVDYLLISHFLLNLQDISTVTSNGIGPSQSLGSDQEPISSIQFVNTIIGNLGQPLRDGLTGDEDEDEGEGEEDIAGIENAGMLNSGLSQPDVNVYDDGSSPGLPMDVKESVAGPSAISV